jgi:hypothetical protein
MRQTAIAFAIVALLVGALGSGTALAKRKPPGHNHGSPGAMSVVATGFNNPRGLTFGPDGNLYVAEGGLGGTHSSASDACPQAHGAAAPYFGSTNDPVRGGRISKISPQGVVSTVVSGLPSSQTSPALGDLVSGVSAVQFVGRTLYGLLAGAGCSHGVPTVPNGVFRVGPGNSWTLIANLSAFLASHPAANPDDEDFEPDGTWYSMAAAGHALYPMDSNHGELDRVSTSGSISRVLDISAVVGHVVPTAIIPTGHKGGGGHHGHGHRWARNGHGHPAFFIANLGQLRAPGRHDPERERLEPEGPQAAPAGDGPRAGARARVLPREAVRPRVEHDARRTNARLGRDRTHRTRRTRGDGRFRAHPPDRHDGRA